MVKLLLGRLIGVEKLKGHLAVQDRIVGGFIRALAVRLGMDLHREPRRLHEEILKLFEREALDQEIQYLKDHYAERFGQAVRAALERLKPRQRLFLVHQVVDRLSIDMLAQIYGIHRASAARRCASAREALARHTRREMRVLLGIGAATLESITQLLHSRMEELLDKNINPEGSRTLIPDPPAR